MPAQEKTGKKKTLSLLLTIFLSLLLVFILVVGAVLFLVRKNVLPEEYNEVRASMDIVPAGLKAIGLGEEASVDCSELNNTLACFIQDEAEKQGMPLKGLYVETMENDDVQCYAVFRAANRDWVFSGRGSLTYDSGTDEICYEVKETKLGGLPLPVSWVLPKLSGMMEEQENVRIEGDSIRIGAGALPVQIKSLRVEKQRFYFTTEDVGEKVLGSLLEENAEDSETVRQLRELIQNAAGQIEDTLDAEGTQKMIEWGKKLLSEFQNYEGDG